MSTSRPPIFGRNCWQTLPSLNLIYGSYDVIADLPWIWNISSDKTLQNNKMTHSWTIFKFQFGKTLFSFCSALHGNVMNMTTFLIQACHVILPNRRLTVLLNSDQEKKKLLHPKSIPTSQCYNCTLIFNNFEMFRRKIFELKPQTGGVNA